MLKMKLSCIIFVLSFTRSFAILVVTLGGKIESKDGSRWEETYVLPELFRFGVATSAYQVEGAYDKDGKGENIWDHYSETHPEVFNPGPNGTDACDSYHNVMRDVDMLRELGVDFYIFSVSWSRVLPTGFADDINFKGLKYYRKLIEELDKYKILPIVTMYNNDLPQPLQDLGGWTNPKIVRWFEDYARVLYTYLPGRSYWIPIHEPSVCIKMYDSLNFNAPGMDGKGILDYLCIKHMLLAHARAYRLFYKEFKSDVSNGLVGMSLALHWADPIGYYSRNYILNQGVDIFRKLTIDLYIHPIYKGDWPSVAKKYIYQHSRKEGREHSRLPSFTKKEIKLMKGASDFIGINYYTSHFIEDPPKENLVYPEWPFDIEGDVTYHKDWVTSTVSNIRSVPYGIHRLCVYINENYKFPPLFITEMGWPSGPGRRDEERVEVFYEFLKAMMMAIMDGSDLRGLAVWSLMDTIEWADGDSLRFGLYEVNFTSPNKTRSPRLSAHYFRRLIETRKITKEFKPYSDDLSLTISPRRAKPRKDSITFSSFTKAENVTVSQVNITSNFTGPETRREVKHEHERTEF